MGSRRRVAAAALAAGALGLGLGAIVVARERIERRHRDGDVRRPFSAERALPGRAVQPAPPLAAPARSASVGGATAAGPGTRGVGASPVAAFLAAHSAREVALFAKFERVTGRAAPNDLGALLDRRRAGASRDELAAEATRRFAGDPLGRAAVLGWLREEPAR